MAKNAIEVRGRELEASAQVLTADALAFVAGLERRFGKERRALLADRQERQRRIDAGGQLTFLEETSAIRGGDWQVAAAPPDLDDRRVEITGPADRKMMINALNSGARVFMADLEDSLSPTWANVIEGQENLRRAVRRTLDFTTAEGKEYRLADDLATLVVRPRGWHLVEKHVWVDGEPVSASLFDFGLYFFHNAHELIEWGSGPYFYLAKLEGHREARLWNEVFLHAQDALGIPRGSVRATVLIETLPAAFEMEEILYELREHAAGLNAGRWDYIFSVIRTYRAQGVPLPDREQVTMTVPFMRAYTELLVRSCHAHGAHAIGGMAAFIPSRRDPEVNRVALAKVREDKKREAAAGFDGTWVAHPDLVPVAREVFDAVLGDEPHQKGRLREDVHVTPRDLTSFAIEGGEITEAGVRTNVRVALEYLDSWLRGIGAAAIRNLMEDAATAEISRSQLWQWHQQEIPMADGRLLTEALYRRIRAEELAELEASASEDNRLSEAADLLDRLVLSPQLGEFLTLPAGELLD